jgi:acyl carrier protein
MILGQTWFKSNFDAHAVVGLSLLPPAGRATSKAGGAAGSSGLSKAAISSLVLSTVSAVLGPDINPDEPLISSGLDSLGAVELRNSLQAQLPAGLELPATLLFDFPSINAISGYIVSQVCLAADADADAQQASSAAGEATRGSTPSLPFVCRHCSLLMLVCTHAIFTRRQTRSAVLYCKTLTLYTMISIPLQVPQQEQEEQTDAISAPKGLPSGPRAAAADTGRIIAVSAYACNSPGGAINGSTAVDAITTIPLQVGISHT